MLAPGCFYGQRVLSPIGYLIKRWMLRRAWAAAPTVIVLGVIVAGCAAITDAVDELTGPQTASERKRGFQVVRVVDGDTIKVRRDGRTQTVRLVGIDAPEASATRFGTASCGGAEATRYARRLAPVGRAVTLEFSGRDREDRYGRALAFVVLPGGMTMQRRMVQAGWADTYVFDGNTTRHTERLEHAKRQARDAHRGVWALCDGEFRRPIR